MVLHAVPLSAFSLTSRLQMRRPSHPKWCQSPVSELARRGPFSLKTYAFMFVTIRWQPGTGHCTS